jgi:NADPH:quinone reductase-like Zn-dependent oxidoreductase
VRSVRALLTTLILTAVPRASCPRRAGATLRRVVAGKDAAARARADISGLICGETDGYLRKNHSLRCAFESPGAISPLDRLRSHFTLNTYMIYNFVGMPILGLQRNEEAFSRAVQFITRNLASRRLKPTIAKTFPLLEIQDAHR